jgi:hypothetical protein
LGHGDRAVAVTVVIKEALHKASAKGHFFLANHSSLEMTSFQQSWVFLSSRDVPKVAIQRGHTIIAA